MSNLLHINLIILIVEHINLIILIVEYNINMPTLTDQELFFLDLNSISFSSETSLPKRRKGKFVSFPKKNTRNVPFRKTMFSLLDLAALRPELEAKAPRMTKIET